MKRILVVYWWPPPGEMRLSVGQHLHALDTTDAEVVYLNSATHTPIWMRLVAFDAIVLHTTFLCARWYDDFADYRRRFRWLARLDCQKIAVPQDEYDHADVLDEWLSELGVSVVCSNFAPLERELLYPRLRKDASFLEVLTGYIDTDAADYCDLRRLPLRERPKDVVYRAQQLPYWFGSHGQMKHLVGIAVSERAVAHDLVVDISTRPEDTIFGRSWLDFLMSGRVVVGCESGSSVLDRRGEMQRRIRKLLLTDPTFTFEQVDVQMPAGWDAYAFFAVSPRHLEAVVAGTAQLLIEGRYNGILKAEQHYLPLRRDLVDLDDALERLADIDQLQRIADRAYEEIYLEGAWTTRQFGRSLLDAVSGGRRQSFRRIASPAVASTGRTLERATGSLGLSTRQSFRESSVSSVLRIRISLAQRILRLLADEPEVIRALISPRAVARLHIADLRPLAGDLLRLSLLIGFAERQAVVGQWRVRAEPGGDVLRMRSVRREEPAAEPARATGAVRRIVWDHSLVADTEPVDPRRPRQASVSVGDGGTYEFRAFSRLTARGILLPWPEVLMRRAEGLE
jgi:hypothetical protein